MNGTHGSSTWKKSTTTAPKAPLWFLLTQWATNNSVETVRVEYFSFRTFPSLQPPFHERWNMNDKLLSNRFVAAHEPILCRSFHSLVTYHTNVEGLVHVLFGTWRCVSATAYHKTHFLVYFHHSFFQRVMRSASTYRECFRPMQNSISLPWLIPNSLVVVNCLKKPPSAEQPRFCRISKSVIQIE